MVEHAEDYYWSSAAGHCGMRDDELLRDPCGLAEQMDRQQWRQWLGDPWEQEEQFTSRLRRCTNTGRPAGGTGFVAKLEVIVGRILRPQKGGRPRKATTNKKDQKHG